jgi:hypothetical protein
MVFASKTGFIRKNKCVTVSKYYGCRRLDLYLDVSGFIIAFCVCIIGMLFYFPQADFEYMLRGAEIGGIFFAGMAIALMVTNIMRVNNLNFIRDDKILFYLNNLFKSIKQWSDEKQLLYESMEDYDKLSRIIWYSKSSSPPVVYIHLEIINDCLDFKIRFHDIESIHSIISYLKKSMIKLGVDDRNILPKKRLKINEKNMVKVYQTILGCILNPIYDFRYFNHSETDKKTCELIHPPHLMN